MKVLRVLLAVSLLIVSPLAAQEDGASRLERFLEDNLSDAGRAVTVRGFRGALTGQAELDSLTIADETGVWLTLTDAVLDWDRAALLRGRLSVRELTADRIDLARLPQGDASALPSPEASGQSLTLPELPVSIEIGELSAETVSIGAGVLGQPLAVTLAGNLRLEGGEGAGSLDLRRIDDKDGEIGLDATFSNASEILDLSLRFDEGPDGVAAGLLGLPGEPSVSLSVEGRGPIDGFEASYQLSTNGDLRIDGVFQTTAEDTGRVFTTTATGDLRPLVEPAYRPFFGPRAELSFAARQTDAATLLDDLTIRTSALSLDGTARFSRDGVPQAFALSGTIKDESGAAIVLPITGPETRIDSAGLTLAFDAAVSDDWTGEVTLDGLERRDVSARRLALSGMGTIGTNPASNSVGLDFEATDLSFSDADAQDAFGETVTGRLDLDWQADTPIKIETLELTGESYGAILSGTIANPTTTLDLAGNARVRADNLAAFSGLVGRPLAGAANLSIEGRGGVFNGLVDARAAILGRDMQLGLAELDTYLKGDSSLEVALRRTTEGTFLERLLITGDQAKISAKATLRTGVTDATLDADLGDIAPLYPGLSGPGALALSARQEEGVWSYDVNANAMAAELASEGVLAGLPELSQLTASGTFEARDFAAFSDLAGLALKGRGQAEFAARRDVTTDAISVTIDGTTTNAGLGIGALDTLLTGTADISLSGDVTETAIEVRSASLRTRLLNASASGTLGENTGFEFTSRIADVAPIAEGLSGPLTAAGTATSLGNGRAELTARFAAPAGSTATLTGDLAEDGSNANLNLRGVAGLALLNGAIAPQVVSGRANFDLGINGRPNLNAVTGRVSLQGARLTAPLLSLGLDDIAGTVDLAGGQAALNLSAAFRGGGQIGLAGPVQLTGSQAADLSLSLNDVRLSDPTLYRTSLDGALRVDGQLTGGALITGRIDVGDTEIQIPSTNGRGSAGLPDITHIDEPSGVRTTRARAGLLETQSRSTSLAAPFGLDVLVNAPNRIFVRGRGLDAEMGGGLRLRGTTRNVAPDGRFDLIRGRLDILGRRLDMTAGSIELTGALDPQLRLEAETEAEDVDIVIALEGPASDPDIRFSSRPELPEDEVLARLIFGRGIDNLSPLQIARLAAAVATLGNSGTGLLGGVRSGAGLADLDVTSDDTGGTAVRAGAYIADNIYTDVTVDSQGDTEVQLNLDLSKSLTVRGRTSTSGDSGLGVFFERDY